MITTATPRAATLGAQRSGRLSGMLLHQARAEIFKLMRAPDFLAGAVFLPVVLFLLFGARSLGTTLDNGVALGPLIVAAFTAYGLLGIVLFTFGESLALERGQGWLRLTRATPLPGVIFLAGKLVAGIVIATIVIVLMAAVSGGLGAGIDLLTWLVMGVVGLGGAVALAPIGFLIGLLVRPTAATAVCLLVYMPVSFASGMWIPADELPELVRSVTPYLPTYHMTQLMQSVLLQTSPWGHASWLAGTFVIAGALALIAYRRRVATQFA